MVDYRAFLLPEEVEEIVQRIGKAVWENPVAINELLRAAEIIAISTSYGHQPLDVIEHGLERSPYEFRIAVDYVRQAWQK